MPSDAWGTGIQSTVAQVVNSTVAAVDQCAQDIVTSITNARADPSGIAVPKNALRIPKQRILVPLKMALGGAVEQVPHALVIGIPRSVARGARRHFPTI